MSKRFRLGFALFVGFLGFSVTPASAATCSQATTQGTAPSTWQTYCWLDFTGYSDATARSAAGQNFSVTLSDGATLTFNLKLTGSPTTTAIPAPSWTGAAVGNTAFMGIPGRPVLYQQAGGTNVITISNILITPPPGVPAVTAYMFVAADAESTNNGESLSFNTNGGTWTILDQVNPISGNLYPTIAGAGTTTFTETGVAGTVGGYIVGSNSPTTVTTTLVGGGLQGAMFAVRFASIRLNKTIGGGGRVNAADQFKFDITATTGGTLLATGTSTGSGSGPFTAAAVSLASGIPLTLSETMAAGSVSAMSQYRSQLTCTNSSTGSSTPLPSAVTTTSYSFGTLQFGDAVQCTFNNTAYPHLSIQKALGAGGRQFDTDQFVMNLKQGATTVATATTTGTGATVTTGATPLTQVTAGTAYNFTEAAAGATILAQYTSAMGCTNSFTGSSTTLPTTIGGSVAPQVGDLITCIITNTKITSNANLVVVKSSTIISDPVNGTTNPKTIPGAIVRYSLQVSNTGPLSVNVNTVFMIDTLPTQMRVGTSSAPAFVQGTPSSALTFAAGTDVRYSNQTIAPANFAACSASPHNYTPVSAYDPAVKYVCFNPKGAMAGSTGTPTSFTITLLAQLN